MSNLSDKLDSCIFLRLTDFCNLYHKDFTLAIDMYERRKRLISEAYRDDFINRDSHVCVNAFYGTMSCLFNPEYSNIKVRK